MQASPGLRYKSTNIAAPPLSRQHSVRAISREGWSCFYFQGFPFLKNWILQKMGIWPNCGWGLQECQFGHILELLCAQTRNDLINMFGGNMAAFSPDYNMIYHVALHKKCPVFYSALLWESNFGKSLHFVAVYFQNICCAVILEKLSKSYVFCIWLFSTFYFLLTRKMNFISIFIFNLFVIIMNFKALPQFFIELISFGDKIVDFENGTFLFCKSDLMSQLLCNLFLKNFWKKFSFWQKFFWETNFSQS